MRVFRTLGQLFLFAAALAGVFACVWVLGFACTPVPM